MPGRTDIHSEANSAHKLRAVACPGDKKRSTSDLEDADKRSRKRQAIATPSHPTPSPSPSRSSDREELAEQDLADGSCRYSARAIGGAAKATAATVSESRGSAASHKISPSSLSHIVLKTSPATLASMKDWWLSLLDAEVTFENEQICFLGYDEEHHRIGLVALPESGDDADTAKAKIKTKPESNVFHIAFTFHSLSQLVAFYRSRKERGTTPTACVNHGPTTSMYYEDPDGNGVEVMVWNLDTREEVDGFLKTPEFQANPVGVNIDPAELARRLDSGEDEASIKRREEIGPRSVADL